MEDNKATVLWPNRFTGRMPGMKKKAKGRPRKKFGHRADRITFRVTPQEKAMFANAAEKAEMDFSDWLRAVVQEAARKRLGE